MDAFNEVLLDPFRSPIREAFLITFLIAIPMAAMIA